MDPSKPGTDSSSPGEVSATVDEIDQLLARAVGDLSSRPHDTGPVSEPSRPPRSGPPPESLRPPMVLKQGWSDSEMPTQIFSPNEHEGLTLEHLASDDHRSEEAGHAGVPRLTTRSATQPPSSPMGSSARVTRALALVALVGLAVAVLWSAFGDRFW